MGKRVKAANTKGIENLVSVCVNQDVFGEKQNQWDVYIQKEIYFKELTQVIVETLASLNLQSELAGWRSREGFMLW